jgi:hypothetical protein
LHCSKKRQTKILPTIVLNIIDEVNSRESFPNLEAIQEQTSFTGGIHGPDYKIQEQ